MTVKEQINHLADDIFLAGDKRKAFILEMHSMTQLMRKDDWNQFYNIADVVMQKYS
jgi:hypothetical protein